MSEQELKRRRISDLLDAEVDPNKIADIVSVSVRTVRNVRMAKAEGKTSERKAGSGGNGLKRSDSFLGDLKKKIESDPTTSMRRLANTFNVDPRTIGKAIHDDLGLNSYVRTPRHLLTSVMKERRLERCKKVLNSLKSNPSTVKIYSDKKIFTVDQVYNRRNDRWLAESKEEVKGVFRTKHPQQIMVLGVVASDGRKMPPYMFKPKEKIDQHVYYKVLRYTILPWLKANYPAGNYVWTQDGAPAHTSDKAQKFCSLNMANFWDKTFWPPSSPDLNVLDFAVWGYLERLTNKTPHKNVDDLKASIMKHWDEMSADFLVRSCASFRRRVEAVIAVEGGHIE